MPVYDYKCKSHGVFHELATMEDSAKPMACPQCGDMSARVIMLSPTVLEMASERRKAFETNERASHEPVVSTSDRRAFDHQHRNGCGCNAKKPSRFMMLTPDGGKTFPSARPWMISH